MVNAIKEKFRRNSDSVFTLIPDAVDSGISFFGAFKEALGGVIVSMVARR